MRMRGVTDGCALPRACAHAGDSSYTRLRTYDVQGLYRHHRTLQRQRVLDIVAKFETGVQGSGFCQLTLTGLSKADRKAVEHGTYVAAQRCAVAGSGGAPSCRAPAASHHGARVVSLHQVRWAVVQAAG